MKPGPTKIRSDSRAYYVEAWDDDQERWTMLVAFSIAKFGSVGAYWRARKFSEGFRFTQEENEHETP